MLDVLTLASCVLSLFLAVCHVCVSLLSLLLSVTRTVAMRYYIFITTNAFYLCDKKMSVISGLMHLQLDRLSKIKLLDLRLKYKIRLQQYGFSLAQLAFEYPFHRSIYSIENFPADNSREK